MKYYLIRYSINWGDEADFEGLEVITEEKLRLRNEIFRKAINEGLPGVYLCFGTNEWDDDYPLEDLIFDPKEKYGVSQELTENEYDTILSTIGSSFGYYPFYTAIDQIEENDCSGELEELIKKYKNE